MAEGIHPFPSRTRKLSPPAPKILVGQPAGKIGRCQIKSKPLGENQAAFCILGSPKSCPLSREATSMALRADRSIGDQGEQQAVALLVERGYLAELFGNRNNPIYDIQVGGRGPFRISVKTSRTKQQVCLGKLNSVK